MLEFPQFVQAFDAFTSEHGALVVDQTAQSSTLSESIFHYSASMSLPRFCMVNATYLKLWNAMKFSDEQVTANRERDQSVKLLRRLDSTRKKGSLAEGGITFVMNSEKSARKTK